MNKNNKKINLILHDIRSTHNVGSIFRTADAGGVDKIYLTGYTPAPIDRFGRRRKDVAKVALGAEEDIRWENDIDIIELVSKLKKEKFRIIGVEQAEDSVNYKNIKLEEDTVFIFGNEVKGISKEVLKNCDMVVEIPMKGKKESLNVSVAVGVILFNN